VISRRRRVRQTIRAEPKKGRIQIFKFFSL
jgi:hypothetical protein